MNGTKRLSPIRTSPEREDMKHSRQSHPLDSPALLLSGCMLLTVASVCCALSAPSDGSVDAHKPETLGDDEWSEAWAEYRRECKEEDEEARAKGITEEDVKNQTAPDVPQEAPKPLSAGQCFNPVACA
jgi:hypothetical protein